MASLLLAVVGLALVSLVATPPARIEEDLTRIVAAVPVGLAGLWRTLIDFLLVFALISVGGNARPSAVGAVALEHSGNATGPTILVRS